ncbi:hypothetical protein GQ599_10095, partial [Streptococcus thermophilus]|nr:hypothetical protein [Streptococcus thermophilus]
YGTWRKESRRKKNYNLPMPKMTNTDLARILKSEEIQSAIRPPNKIVTRRKIKKNPLSNRHALLHLNPFARVEKKAATIEQKKRIEAKAALEAK